MLKRFLFAMPFMALLTCFSLSSCCDGADDDFLSNGGTNNGGTQNGGQNNGGQDGDENDTYTYEFTTYATDDLLDLFDTDVTFTMGDGSSSVTRLSQPNEKVTYTSNTYQDFTVFYKSTAKDDALGRIDNDRNYTFPLSAYTINVVDKDGNVIKSYSGGGDLRTVKGSGLKRNMPYFSDSYELTYNRNTAELVFHSNNDNEYVDEDANTLTVTEGDELGLVDLGLSVAWTAKNLVPVYGGDIYNGNCYFAWGETKTKSGSYTWANYNLMDSNDAFTKYNATDKLTTLTEWDDAAWANREFYAGNDFIRLPTAQEVRELIEKCKWTWGTYNGEAGYKVEGPNGNSIFLPAAGAMGNNSIALYGHAEGYGNIGAYWTCELKENSQYPYQVAYCLCFENSSAKTEITIDGANQPRYAGCSVRAVSTKWGF